MVTRVIQPNSDRPLLKENGSPDNQFNLWLKIISENSLIIGDTEPENEVEASQGAFYMNSNGVAGAILYIKRDADIMNDKTKGWILV